MLLSVYIVVILCKTEHNSLVMSKLVPVNTAGAVMIERPHLFQQRLDLGYITRTYSLGESIKHLTN